MDLQLAISLPAIIKAVGVFLGKIGTKGRIKASKYILGEIDKARNGLFYKVPQKQIKNFINPKDIIPIDDIPMGAIYATVKDKNGKIIGGIIKEGEVFGGAVSDYIDIWNSTFKK